MTPPSAPYDRATLDAMVAYLRAHLVKTVPLGSGETLTALSETAVRFNDSTWFWTDDNAKAAELLCEPGLFDQDPATADAALDFVLRMSEGDLVGRRCGPAELRVLSADPAAFRVETAFVILEGDLTRGVVRHALRFNDNRTVTAAQHGPAPLSLRCGWRRLRMDPATAISSFAVTATATTVTLSHTSALDLPALRPGAPRRALGELRYTYTLAADRPEVELAVSLAPVPGVAFDDVAFGTALEGLDQTRDLIYRTVAVRRGEDDRFVRSPADGPVHRGAADYVAVVQEGTSPGFSYAIHALLADGGRLARVVVRRGKRRLRRLRHVYGIKRVQAPGVTVTERRMVTGGGYYDVLAPYAQAMRPPEGAEPGAGRLDADPSMSYDVGAELNAVAVHLLFARRGAYAAGPDAARLERLEAWYDRHVERYFAFIRPGSPDERDRVFTRGLAFVVLSLDCMVRAAGRPRHRELLATGVRLLLDTLEPRSGEGDAHAAFSDVWSRRIPFLDNHAACILALARAAWHGDPDGALSRAVHAAVRGVRLHSDRIDVGGGHRVAYDGLAVLNAPGGRAHADTGFWNYKLGVVLRALNATLAAADAGVLAATPDERSQARLRIDLAHLQLASSMRVHDDGLEMLTSRLAGETNSETQPWTALGLVPLLDEQIVALAPP